MASRVTSHLGRCREAEGFGDCHQVQPMDVEDLLELHMTEPSTAVQTHTILAGWKCVLSQAVSGFPCTDRL